jgi:hypothetical protein
VTVRKPYPVVLTRAWLPRPEELFAALIEEVRFALDSPLEESGFEPLVTAANNAAVLILRNANVR